MLRAKYHGNLQTLLPLLQEDIIKAKDHEACHERPRGSHKYPAVNSHIMPPSVLSEFPDIDNKTNQIPLNPPFPKGGCKDIQITSLRT